MSNDLNAATANNNLMDVNKVQGHIDTPLDIERITESPPVSNVNDTNNNLDNKNNSKNFYDNMKCGSFVVNVLDTIVIMGEQGIIIINK